MGGLNVRHSAFFPVRLLKNALLFGLEITGYKRISGLRIGFKWRRR